MKRTLIYITACCSLFLSTGYCSIDNEKIFKNSNIKNNQLSSLSRTLRIATQGSLNRLDPHILNETFSIGLMGNVLEGLITRDKNLNIKPALATHWQKVTPTHWRFFLRKNVYFHDGTKFTAEDVLFSFARARAPGSQVRMHIPEDIKIKAHNTYTIDVFLKKPMPIFHYGLEHILITSKEWAISNKINNAALIQKPLHLPKHTFPVGTGAFSFSEHNPGITTTFQSNKHWWGVKFHNFDTVKLTTVRTPVTRVAALTSNRVDIITSVPLSFIDGLKSNPDISLATQPELRTIFLNLDSARAQLRYANVQGKNPFKDRRVRQAFARAINIDLLRDKIMRGYARPSALLIAPELFAAPRGLSRYIYDPAHARALMAAAGYGEGFSIVLDCPNNRYVNDEQLCIAIGHMLAAINVAVTVRAVPKAQYFHRITSASRYDSSMNLLGWTPSTLDGLEILTSLAGCRDENGNGGLFNMGGYCNPNVDRLANQIRSETNLLTRTRKLAEAFRIIHDDAGLIPLHQQMITSATQRDIEITIRPDNIIRFNMIRRIPRSDHEHRA